jgi:hypothetical protein
MMRNVKDLRGYAIRATDGVIGRVADFHFDDEDWGGAGFWGTGAYPGGLTAGDTITEELRTAAAHAPRTPDDSHLRSTNVVIGYQVHATDGNIGRIDDLLVGSHIGNPLPERGHEPLVDRAMHHDRCLTLFTRAGGADSRKGTLHADRDDWTRTNGRQHDAAFAAGRACLRGVRCR